MRRLIDGLQPESMNDKFDLGRSFGLDESYRKKWTSWCSESEGVFVSGLDRFESSYFVNGITEAIERVILERDQYSRIVIVYGEVGYYKFLCTIYNIPYIVITNPEVFEFKDEDLFCWSQPFSLDGRLCLDYARILERALQMGAKTFLDLAYFGSGLFNIVVPIDCTYVSLSLSKSMGVSGLRAGILFSKYKIKSLELRKKIGNFGTWQMKKSIDLMGKYSSRYAVDTYTDRYNELSLKNKLEKTDSVTFMITRNRDHFLYLPMFIRGEEEVARIPTSWLMKTDLSLFARDKF